MFQHLRPMRPRAALLVLLLFLGLISLAGFVSQSQSLSAAGDPVVVAAGDIACDPAATTFNGGSGGLASCRQKYTYDLIANINPTAVLALGDDQYYCGSLTAFQESYALSWGKVKSITKPVPGNHEYLTSPGSVPSTDCTSANAGAAGYFNYFGSLAGPVGKGYYSYDIGAWHLIALNSQCNAVGGCGSGSTQETWLRSDLSAHRNQCILAYWHVPRWSSGGQASTLVAPFVTDLYNARADLILTGHDHTYERFALQSPSGALDTARGIREFVAGTGGANHTSFVTTAANSQVRNNTTFGVLKLTLRAASYDWQFVPEAGKTFTDSGTQACHNATASTTTTPTASPTMTKTAVPTATPTNTPTATPTVAVSGTTIFNPAADSYVDSSNPTVNYGTSMQIRTDGSPVVNSYLRFNVQGLTGTVTGATLRIYANSGLASGYDLPGVADNSWTETGLTWNNAPAIGATLGSSGAITAGTWTVVDVTAYVTANGTYSFAITDPSITALSLASRESANPPQLVITTQ